MKTKLFIGIDTSNYTTSVAVADDGGNILANLKYLLPVKEGERGLRQSEAVFAHIKNFPAISEEIKALVTSERFADCEYAAVGYSAFPRDSEGSYMPCFLVGEAVARMLAAFLDLPLYRTSHQAGHIMAAAATAWKQNGISLEEFIPREHIGLHVSGGTTDLLLVRPSEEKVFDITRIGGSADANAGQIVDRTGVRLGFRFPAGPAVDDAAMRLETKPARMKVSIKGLETNLSGVENKAEKMIADGCTPEEVSAFVLEHIARTVDALVSTARDAYGALPVVFAGGVMSSGYIRRRLKGVGIFSEAVFSSDNAAGVALITRIKYNKDNTDKEDA